MLDLPQPGAQRPNGDGAAHDDLAIDRDARRHAHPARSGSLGVLEHVQLAKLDAGCRSRKRAYGGARACAPPTIRGIVELDLNRDAAAFQDS